MSVKEILFALVAFLSNIVQSVTGFAGTVLAMPVSIRLVGYDTARPILNFIAVFICLFVVIFTFKSINWKKLLYLKIFVGIGFGLGFFIQKLSIDQNILLKIYGVIICIVAILFFFIKNLKVPSYLHPPILILAGILHFLYTSGGPLVIIYASSAFEDKDEFRSTLSFMWIILNSIVLTTNLVSGQFTVHIWILCAVISGASVASFFLGKLIAKKLNQEVFMKVTYVLLFISGLSAIF